MSELESDLESLFNAARELRDPGQRQAFIAAACADNHELRHRLDNLLAVQPEADAFFDQALEAGEKNASALDGQSYRQSGAPELIQRSQNVTQVDDAVGTLVGRYKLLQKIGEGGCGIVYMAEQVEPLCRRVAVKVIKLGMDTQSVIARFEAEQQALALMEHANIARVLDVGATASGRPFFVMELVRGTPITRYCDKLKLRTEDRLKLFVEVCHAIQHAHQKGVIHRDIKPSNILVTVNDGVAVPKVIDFGIAKATNGKLIERTLFTAFDQFIGTPAYVSPEQAEMTSLDVDTRSDIYSLGVLLYELLIGKTPFDAASLASVGLDEMRRRIRDQEPPCPSNRLKSLSGEELTTTAQHRQDEGPKLIQRVRGDLDWIVMKCLEKERSRRYATANGLAADVQRYLENEPVVARPPSSLYRLEKLARRHRLAFVAGVLVLTTLLVASVVSTRQAIRATRAVHEESRARAAERSQRQRAERNLYAAEMIRAHHYVEMNNLGDALKLLQRNRPTNKDESDLRGFEWRYLWQRCQGDANVPLQKVGLAWWLEYSSDGRWLAACGNKGVTVSEVKTRKMVAEIRRPSGQRRDGPLSCLFTPDCQTLITASEDGVNFYETVSWTQKAAALTNDFGPIAITPDGRSLATMHSSNKFQQEDFWKDVRIWNLQEGEVSRTLPQVGGPPVFSPDGALLATDSPEGITLWPLNSATAPPILLTHSKNLLNHISGLQHLRKTIAFSPDGRLIAVAGKGGIGLWDVATARGVTQLSGLRGDTAVAFSPTGAYLACSSMERVMLLWEVGQWQKPPRQLRGHLDEVWSLAFAPDGKNLASGGLDRLRLWSLDFPNTAPHDQGRFQVYWLSADGNEIVTGAEDRLERWDTRSGNVLHSLYASNSPPGLNVLIVASDGRTVVGGYTNGEVRVADLLSGSLKTLPFRHSGQVQGLAISPDRKTLASMSNGTELFWWDFPAGQVVRTNRLPEPVGPYTKFSPDGKTLATRGAHLLLWDARTGSLKPISFAESRTFAFSPNNLTLVTSSPLQLWNLSDGSRLGRPLEGHKQMVYDVTFSHDGLTVASASDDGTLRLWSVDTQQELLTFREPETTFNYPLFSADGGTLVAGSMPNDAGIRIWRAPSFAQIDALEKANLHNH